MTASDWINLGQSAALVYFAWQQNRIFARQAPETMPNETPRTLWLKRYWPTLMMILVLLAIGFDIYDRHRQRFGYDPATAWDDSKPLERIYPRTFRNETIVLDGKLFIDPIFDRVTFVYNGTAPFGMNNPKFARHPGEPLGPLESRNKIVTQTMKMDQELFNATGCSGWTEDHGPESREGVTPPPK